MTKFDFTGDWNPFIVLREFGRLNHPDLFRKFTEKDDFFRFKIDDYNDNNPDPIETQLNSINYIIENQEDLLTSIFEYIKNVVYPKYKIYMPIEEYPECYPDLNTRHDLKNLLALNEILIYIINKDDYSYSVFCFNSRLDYEHGLCITTHKNRCIAWAEMGTLDQEQIKLDNGSVNIPTYIEKDDNLFNNGLYMPHPKYGKLKPWQIKSNKELPNRLLGEDLYQELKEYLRTRSEKETLERLIQLCLWWEKDLEFLDYLLNLNNGCPFSAMEIAVNQKSLKLVKYFFEKGFDVNSIGIGGLKITDLAIRLSLTETNMESNINDIVKFFFDKGGKLENTDTIFYINERQNGNSRNSTIELIKRFRKMEI